MITQWKLQPIDLQVLGVDVYAHLPGLMLHQKLARQKQALLLVFGQSTVPALQSCSLINIGRNLLLVELINELLVNENIRAPGAMLEVFYILDQTLIMSIKIQPCAQLARDQALA